MTTTRTTDPAIEQAVAAYDAIVRSNDSPEWSTLRAVAHCEDGMYGALGELLEVADEFDLDLDDDATRDRLQDAFENYQRRLAREVVGTLEVGKRYCVTTHRARLSWHVPVAPSAWTSDGCRLSEGDVIEYQGRRPGLGSDSIDEDVFVFDHPTRGRVSGAFSPSTWGTADLRALDPERTTQ